MPRKKEQKQKLNPSALFEEAIKQIKKENIEEHASQADILTYAKDILGQKLFPSQKIILKFLYANSRFNEHLKITDEEIEIIKSWSIDHNWILKGFDETSRSKIDVVNNTSTTCKDLVLVLGRRSGKSYISSLIATYEAYKLLELKDPQKFYGITSDIYIINTAVTAHQASSEIFTQMAKFISECPYFMGRAKIRERKITLLTDADIERNEKIKDAGGDPLDGSVIIYSGSSNSPALRGHAATTIIYDEIAHYVKTDNTASAAEVYNALSRSVKTFVPKGDGLNICISSPDEMNGFFYKHYRNAQRIDSMQVFQIPSWDANPNFTYDDFKDEFDADPDAAMCEYGARFKTAATSAYFPEDKIDLAFANTRMRSDKPIPGFEYYMHVDSATSSDNWACVIGHPEFRWDKKTRQLEKYFVEDYSYFWSPQPGKHLDEDEIMDRYVIPLAKKFRVVSFTYDMMFSQSLINKLNGNRINHDRVVFNGVGKNRVYDTARNALIREKVILCSDDFQLMGEMKNIRVDYSKKKPVITKNPRSDDFPDDDVCDCMCALIYRMELGASGKTKLPKSSVIFTGRR